MRMLQVQDVVNDEQDLKVTNLRGFFEEGNYQSRWRPQKIVAFFGCRDLEVEKTLQNVAELDFRVVINNQHQDYSHLVGLSLEPEIPG